jgi:hypothetical protein
VKVYYEYIPIDGILILELFIPGEEKQQKVPNLFEYLLEIELLIILERKIQPLGNDPLTIIELIMQFGEQGRHLLIPNELVLLLLLLPKHPIQDLLDFVMLEGFGDGQTELADLFVDLVEG